MKNIFIIVLTVSILSCSGENKNEIPLFNELTFKLYDGEVSGVINSNLKARYTEYFNNNLIQVPLFKYVKHKNYDIFIGIPYNTSIEQMVQNQLDGQNSVTADLKSDSNSYYKTYKRNEFYIVEYASLIESKSLIYVSTMSNSKELTDSLFTEVELANRINANN